MSTPITTPSTTPSPRQDVVPMSTVSLWHPPQGGKGWRGCHGNHAVLKHQQSWYLPHLSSPGMFFHEAETTPGCVLLCPTFHPHGCVSPSCHSCSHSPGSTFTSCAGMTCGRPFTVTALEQLSSGDTDSPQTEQCEGLSFSGNSVNERSRIERVREALSA